MNFHRYTDVGQFVNAVRGLQAYRGEYVSEGLLESLEASRLLIPRVRLCFPDPVARRFWLEDHEGVDLAEPTEPDGPRWDAAVELQRALHRWANPRIYGVSAHPLDTREARILEFIEDPAATPFRPWRQRQVSVASERNPVHFDTRNIRSYYSSWQLLVAGEVADAGVHFRIDVSNEQTLRAALGAVHDGTPPAGARRVNFLPVYALRALLEHERTLDAVVFFAEESERALEIILRDQPGGRFRLTEAQNDQYDRATQDAARASAERYALTVDAIGSRSSMFMRAMGRLERQWARAYRECV